MPLRLSTATSQLILGASYIGALPRSVRGRVVLRATAMAVAAARCCIALRAMFITLA